MACFLDVCIKQVLDFIVSGAACDVLDECGQRGMIEVPRVSGPGGSASAACCDHTNDVTDRIGAHRGWNIQLNNDSM